MDLLKAPIVCHGPFISIIYVGYVGFGGEGNIVRKDDPIKVVLQGPEIIVCGGPRGVAIGGDGIVVGDGLWLDGGGTRGEICVNGDDVVFGGPEAEISPGIIKGHPIRSAPGAGVCLVGREEFDVEDVEGGPDGQVEEVLAGNEVVEAGDVEDGKVSDFENREERAIFEDGGFGWGWTGGAGHVDQRLSEIRVGLGVIVPTGKTAREGVLVLGDGPDEVVESMMTLVSTVRERAI